jgi:hypothetical protein
MYKRMHGRHGCAVFFERGRVGGAAAMYRRQTVAYAVCRRGVMLRVRTRLQSQAARCRGSRLARVRPFRTAGAGVARAGTCLRRRSNRLIRSTSLRRVFN